MFELFQMWALVEVLGIVCLPLTVTVCQNLPDRGWAFSKALGLALLAFLVWFPLMCVHVLPFNQLFILGILLLLVASNLFGFLRMRSTFTKILRSNLAYIIAVELVFLGMVFLLGFLRSYKPDIYSNEMYMDEGFIAAILRSQHFPPNDMWYAGYGINYYYYAHYTIGVLAKLLGQSPSIAFNTGICIFFGLTALCLFGVTCNIVGWARQARVQAALSPSALRERFDTLYPSLLKTMPFGLLSMIMALVLGNLAATQQWWQNHGNAVTFDWYAPSRVVPNTINEFPAFSFLLSCFHAHVLALAFTILAIGLALNLLLEPEGKGLNIFGTGWRLPLNLGMTALILGSMFTMNGWDFPTYVGLALMCILVQQWLAYNARFEWALLLDIATPAVSLVALSFILYLPFYLNFVSPSQGVGLVPANQRSSLRDVMLIYGMFAFIFISLLLISAARRPLFPLALLRARGESTSSSSSSSSWLVVGGVATAILFVLTSLALFLLPNSTTFIVGALIALMGVVVLFYNVGDRAHAFTLLLGTVAFALIAGCEVFFLRDVFADGQYMRMNTVFKFYFQAWALLSIASGAGLYFILQSFRFSESLERSTRAVLRGAQGVWCVGCAVLLLAGAVYPVLAPAARLARTNPQTQVSYWQRSNSLDGLTYLKNDPATPGDYDAIRWLNTHVSGDPVLIEGIGDDYSTASRISAFTGLPTPMGWVGHEYQWRVKWKDTPVHADDFNRRGSDIEQIYLNADSQQVLELMKLYNAQYLYVGSLEKAKYGAHADLQRYDTFMQIAYQTPEVTIYKVK